MRQFGIKHLIFVLFFLALLIRIYNLGQSPFTFDSTLYAEMIAEESDELTFLPRYLGMWAPWKPGLFFMAYSLFPPFTSMLFNSLEWIYRFPNLIFGLLNAFVFYLIAKKFTQENIALAASLLFYSSYGIFYTDARLLMETFTLLPILLAILFYASKEIKPEKRFLSAALFGLAAAFTKSVIALMLIPLAIAYIVQEDKKNLTNPFFLISLLAPLLGMLFFYLALDNVGLVDEILVEDTGKFFVYNYFDSATLANVFFGIVNVFVMSPLCFIISIKKMSTSWKKHLFFTVWLLLAIVPTFSGFQILWHLYYVVPAFAFFTAISLSHNERMDNFSAVALSALVLTSFIIILVVPLWDGEALNYEDEVGLMVSGKENVMVVGYYDSATTVVTYKLLSERENLGHSLDFGYVILYVNGEIMESSDLAYALKDVLEDYNTQKYDFEEDNFADMFQTDKLLKKKTDITEFDYLVICLGNISYTVPEEYSLEYNGTNVDVYKRSEEPQLQQIN